MSSTVSIRQKATLQLSDSLRGNASLIQEPRYLEILSEVFGYQPLFFTERQGDEIQSVFPCAKVSHPLLGKKLVSLPLDVTYGGVLSRGSGANNLELMKKVIDYARSEGCDFVQLRGPRQDPDLDQLGFRCEQPCVTTDLELTTREANWQKLNRGHQSSVKRAKKEGVVVEKASSETELRDFYRVLALNFRKFGSPIFPYKLIKKLWDEWSQTPQMDLLLAKVEGKTIGGVLILHQGSTSVYKYGAVLDKYNPLRPYQLLLWKAIEGSIERGSKIFNFGLSANSDTGLQDFKGRFGAVHKPVYYYSYILKGKLASSEKLYEGHKTIKKVWTYLPIPLTKLLGSQIFRWVC